MAYGKALDLRQIGTPPTPPAGVSLLYPKSDGKWYTKDPAGTESPLGGASPTTPIIADWNAATANGFYTSLNTATNAPAAVYLLGEVVAVDANNVTQTVWNWVGGTGSDTIAWRRQCVSGTWQAWYRIRMSEAELDARYAAKVHTHGVTDLTATGTKSSTTFLRGDNTWGVPIGTTYAVPTQAEAEAGTATTARAFSAQRVAQAIAALAPVKSVAGKTGAVTLAASDIASGVFPIARGGTNNSALGAAGTIAYSDGSKVAYSDAPLTAGKVLESVLGPPTWTNRIGRFSDSTVSDWNAVTVSGWYSAAGAANAPTPDAGHIYLADVRTYPGSLGDLQITQTLWNPYPNSERRMYRRRGSLPYNGTVTFEAWQPVRDTVDELDARYGGVGEIKMVAGTPWPGWLVCDGTQYTQAAYPKLYAQLGGTGGVFNVPDLRDRVPMGASSTKPVGSVGGADSVQLAEANLPPHTHNMDHDHPNSNFNVGYTANTTQTGIGVRVNMVAGVGGSGGTIESASINIPTRNKDTGNGNGTSTPLNIKPKYAAVNFLMRAE